MDDPDEEMEEEEIEMIESEFKFWPIGQGLFYTGSIDGGKFNFVYDCGASAMVSGGKAALSKATKEYLKELEDGWDKSASDENTKYLNHKTIDFMVVSHLDADHVNGIFELLSWTCINKLYLPYLGDSRRNEHLIKLIIANAIIDSDESGDAYEKKFRILTEFYERYNEQDKLEQDRRVWKVIHVGGKESLKEEKHIIALKTSWEFRMFSREISEDSFNKLNDAIAKRLDGRTIEQLFLHWNSGSDPMATKLKNLGELKKIYTDIVELSDVNRSSIVLVHYPESEKEASEISIECEKECRRFCDNCCDLKCYRRIGRKESMQKPVTVLTGDAEFDPLMRMMLKHIIHQNHCKPFCVMQAPHHGARSEWEALSVTGDDLGVCVIPFGYGNTYGHPAYEIKRDLRELNRSGWRIAMIEVTQLNKFTYRIHHTCGPLHGPYKTKIIRRKGP